MPEQLNIVSEFIPYILVLELMLLCIFQIQTNHLLKRELSARTERRSALKTMKEEVKAGTSEIPVIRFEKQKKPEPEERKTGKEKNRGYDEKELAVLQEMMAEFFG